MSSVMTGRAAEQAVAKFMTESGYQIIATNWRTRRCEIDIVAKKENVMYFVEVKYRKNDSQGDGLDYITPSKLAQMHFAANIWAQENSWEGDMRLLAASVDGGSNNIIEIVEM